jgi:hypothetical protein
MSTLPDLAEAMCKRVAARDIDGCRSLALQMAAKMGEPRGLRIQRAFGAQAAAPVVNLKHWSAVAEPRSPWTPESVRDGIDRWLDEAKFADALVSAGERVLPLLLSGETRCGKTSSLAAAAIKIGAPVYRVSIASVIGSHVGETAHMVKAALAEATKSAVRAVWLMDEIDAISSKRKGGSAAEDERASGVAALLTEIESLPPGTLLCATTNTVELMDSAVVARFQVVEFPVWGDLAELDRLEFARSHGYAAACDGAGSYADVVKSARRARVDTILAAAKTGKPIEVFAGENAELFAAKAAS